MKIITLLVFFITFGIKAEPIYTRPEPSNGDFISSHFIEGGTCNEKGREQFLTGSLTKNVTMSFLVCAQTVGKQSKLSSYTINGPAEEKWPANRVSVGCSVSDDRIATGYTVIWFSFGNHLPSDITDASQSMVIEQHGQPAAKRFLMNYHTKKDVLVDLIRSNGTRVSNVIIPKNNDSRPPPQPLSPGTRVVNIRYSFPYTGGEIPCGY